MRFFILTKDGTKSIIEMTADGNCLFRSLSDQLYYDYGNRHVDVRDDVVDYMEDHKDDFIVFLVLDDQEDDTTNNNNTSDKDNSSNDNDATDFESYCHAMRQDGTWGGNLELVAASKVYRYVSFVLQHFLECFPCCFQPLTYVSLCG
jgi:OTU-like cysteine protease